MCGGEGEGREESCVRRLEVGLRRYGKCDVFLLCRQLLGSIRALEKEISLASKSTDRQGANRLCCLICTVSSSDLLQCVCCSCSPEAVEELHVGLSELKTQLDQAGQELNVLIK